MTREILLAGYGANNLLGWLLTDYGTDDEQSHVPNEAELQLNLILRLQSKLFHKQMLW